MLTPQFKVTQDEKYVHVIVKISSIRFSAPELELVVTKNVMVFHLSPYYLRLRFPHNLVDDERATAEYKASDETIHINLPKENAGEFFDDLDMPTKLLAREGDVLNGKNELFNIAKNGSEIPKKALIEEVGSSRQDDDVTALGQIGEKFNWEIQQNVNEVDNGSILKNKYGFDNNYDTIISVSVVNGNDINELSDPEKLSATERIKERVKNEDLKFDAEYYVSELMTQKYANEEELIINGIGRLLKYVPPVVNDYLKWYKNAEDKNAVMPITFTDKEQEQMQKNLPKKEYIVENHETLYISMLNILFSYIFEQIENEGQHQTESAWTIGKLTPQLSFLDQQLISNDETMIVELEKKQSKLGAAITIGIKQALSYPLHRNFDLTMRSWNFVYYLLRGGKRLIIRSLLDVHEIFRFHDVYYVYNKVLLDDLCSWFISQGSEAVIRSLAIEVKKQLDLITPECINFNCIAGFNESTGEPSWENLTLKEMELLAESEYHSSK